jgi:hypothetical protein
MDEPKPDLATHERLLKGVRQEVRNLQVMQMRPGQSAAKLAHLADLEDLEWSARANTKEGRWGVSDNPTSKGADAVISSLKCQRLFAASIGIALGAATPERAAAVTVEVARKCQALTSAAYPPREPGNPAAGSAKGAGRDKYNYFKKCVANGGKMDDAGAKQAK